MFLFLTNNMAAVTSRQTNNIDITIHFPEKLIGHFSSPGPLYQNEVKCSAFDMELIQIKLIFTRKVVYLASF